MKGLLIAMERSKSFVLLQLMKKKLDAVGAGRL